MSTGVGHHLHISKPQICVNFYASIVKISQLRISPRLVCNESVGDLSGGLATL